MRKFAIIGLLAVALGCSSCKKTETKQSPTPQTTLAFTVRDVNSWSSSNTGLSMVAGATVKVYSTQADVIANAAPKYTATSDASGKVTIPVVFQSQYFFTTELGTAKNTLNNILILGADQNGVVELQDANGDGIINSRDATYADVINVVQSQTVAQTSFIYH